MNATFWLAVVAVAAVAAYAWTRADDLIVLALVATVAACAVA